MNRAQDDYRRSSERTVAVDAVVFGRASLGTILRQARETAGLTQVELAKRLGKSQTLISHVELGSIHISERHVKAVLRACGLPTNWKSPST